MIRWILSWLHGRTAWACDTAAYYCECAKSGYEDGWQEGHGQGYDMAVETVEDWLQHPERE